jgi:acetolactate synthase I/III small subunit
MRHTISVTVHNQPGVLSRVANLFSARGYNIDSLVVGETENHQNSRMTIVVRGDDRIIDQVDKQLNKLVDVVKVVDLTNEDFIARDLALIKVRIDDKTRSHVMEIVQCFNAKIVDVAQKSVTIEATGKEAKINALTEILRRYGISELVRTGEVAILRGKRVHEPEEKKTKVKAGKAGLSNL